jgi:sec-independent protein translocase protein TatA
MPTLSVRSTGAYLDCRQARPYSDSGTLTAVPRHPRFPRAASAQTEARIMSGALSGWHWVIVLAIVLLIFGGSRLPGLGKGLGQSIRGFRSGLKDDDQDEKAKELPPGDGPAEGS